MKYVITLLCIISYASYAENHKIPTYEELNNQVQQEADEKIYAYQEAFANIYYPSLLKIGITAGISGFLVPIMVYFIKKDQTVLASLAATAVSAGFYIAGVFSAHLLENRRTTNKECLEADRVYQQKMAHIHTRHYLNDIAKFLAFKAEELIKKYTMETTSPTQDTL